MSHGRNCFAFHGDVRAAKRLLLDLERKEVARGSPRIAAIDAASSRACLTITARIASRRAAAPARFWSDRDDRSSVSVAAGVTVDGHITNRVDELLLL